MRSLQALDATLSGASQREAAIALFGTRRVARDWSADGALRAQIRFYLRHAHALTSGGYRHLLDVGPGESGPSADSPSPVESSPPTLA
jgi:hypothetical protein